jgi:hypothetical protein
MVRVATLLTVTLLCGTARGAGSEHTIRGTVRDEAGKKVGGIEVATTWDFEDGPNTYGGARTGGRGEYWITVETYGKPVAVLALDVAERRAAIACVDPERDSTEDVDLVLGPATRVFGKLASAELGHAPEWTNGYVYARYGDGRVRFAECSSVDAEFSFLLPEGEYLFNFYGTDTESRADKHAVQGAELDLGTIDLPATKLAKLYGEPAPELTISAARGIDRQMRLADLRGKFVVLEFWGHW